ncbi:MAG: hypothetical protein ABI747_04560 [Candidatus Moraniibacteriota bacterium]
MNEPLSRFLAILSLTLLANARNKMDILKALSLRTSTVWEINLARSRGL